MKLVYVLLFVLSIELFFSYAQLYSWQDGKTAPIECVKKCKASEFNVSIIQKNRIFYLPEECKKICFEQNPTSIEPASVVLNPQNQSNSKEQKRKISPEQVQQIKKEILQNESDNESDKERLDIKEKVEQNEQKNKTINPIPQSIQQRNEQIKQIRQEIKENIKNKTILRTKTNVEVEAQIKEQEREIEIPYQRFKIIFKNATIENNTIKVENKTILLPQDLNISQPIKELKIIQNQNKIFYKLKTANKGKLLGIFDMEYDEEKEIDATSSNSTTVQSPWWKIFVFR